MVCAEAGARTPFTGNGWFLFIDLLRAVVLMFGAFNLALMSWLLIGNKSTWRTKLRFSGLLTYALATVVCMYTEWDQRGQPVGTGGRLWIVIVFMVSESLFIIQAHKS